MELPNVLLQHVTLWLPTLESPGIKKEDPSVPDPGLTQRTFCL